MNRYSWIKENIIPVKTHKVRIGNNRDGGYVVPSQSIRECDLFLSFGLGTNITYENHLHLLKKKVIGYDVKKMKQPWARQMKLSCYNDFINILEVKEYNKILLKMDVEGAEWEFFNTLDIDHFCNKVHTFTFELHLPNKPKDMPIAVMDKLLEKYWVVHVHGNNYANCIEDVPTALEITLCNKNCFFDMKLDTQSYPIYKLDHPNSRRSSDLPINWLKKDINFL